jgi:hypothetical protein
MATPSERSTSVTPALPKRPETQSLDIVQQIELIRARCQGPTAGEQPSVPFSVLAPLFDAVCTRLARVNHATTPIHERLDTIETLIKKIDQKTSLKPSPASASYASVAAGGRRAQTLLAPHETPKESARISKEILVKVLSPEEANTNKKLSAEDLIAKIKQGADTTPALRKVIAVKKLASGDIILHTENTADKLALEQETNWVSRIAPSAHIHHKTYAVLIHGVKTASFGRDAGEKPARELERENAHLHPGIRIVRTNWITRLSDKREFSSLIVEVDDAIIANRMISEGVLFGFELKITELYDRACRITQCFNCQKYGYHTKKYCQKKTACGHCGRDHSTEECSVKENKENRRCAACNGGNHEAWSYQCPSRQKEAARARAAYATRRTRFPITAPITPSSTPPMLRFTATAPPALHRRTPGEESDEEWSVVGGDNKKRKVLKRGRPTNLSRPEAHASRQIDTLFSQTSSMPLLPDSQENIEMGNTQEIHTTPTSSEC